MNEFIKGETIYLRPVEESDAERCIEWLNDQETTIFMEHGIYPQKLDNEIEYIKNAECMLAIISRETDEHIGNIELKVNRHTATISILIGKERGNGHGTEAVKLLVDHAFNRIDLHCIKAGTNSLNMACQKVFIKNGFKEYGYGKCYFRGKDFLIYKYKLTKKEWEKRND